MPPLPQGEGCLLKSDELLLNTDSPVTVSRDIKDIDACFIDADSLRAIEWANLINKSGKSISATIQKSDDEVRLPIMGHFEGGKARF